LKLEEKIGEISIPSSGELIWPGAQIYEIFKSLGISFQNAPELLRITDAVFTVLSQQETSASSRKTAKSSISVLNMALKTVFNVDNERNIEEFSKNYKVCALFDEILFVSKIYIHFRILQQIQATFDFDIVYMQY
jgi:hypothetical protein